MGVTNLYEVLGVSRNATDTEIKQAFRRRAMACHPDHNPGEEAARLFREAAAAYEVLGTPRTRAAYDRSLGHTGLTAPPKPQDAAAEPKQTGAAACRPTTRYYDLVLSRREAAQGGVLTLRAPVGRPCASCGGSGVAQRPICPQCRGRGEIRRLHGPIAVFDLCPACGGGGAASIPCPACSGMGAEAGSEEIVLRLPPGMVHGGSVRLPSMGAPGKGGGPAGDLVLRIHVGRSGISVRDTGWPPWLSPFVRT